MPRTVALVGAPLDLGAGGRRGVDMGPSALRLAGLHAALTALGFRVEDFGNVAVEQMERLRPGSARMKYLPQIAATCAAVAERVKSAAAAGKLPFVLGGDHSVAAGTISGMATHLRARKKKLGVVWIDAHADMNTPATTPSGNVHGMPLASLLGHGPRALTHLCGWSQKVDPQNVALVGLRDVDLEESRFVARSGVRAFTMRDIDERGLRNVMQEALSAALAGTEGLHLSFDMDAVDPDEAPGVGTPVRGGLSYREAHLAMELVADTGKLLSLEVVEVNPVLDTANRTALLAVELMASALGKTILGKRPQESTL